MVAFRSLDPFGSIFVAPFGGTFPRVPWGLEAALASYSSLHVFCGLCNFSLTDRFNGWFAVERPSTRPIASFQLTGTLNSTQLCLELGSPLLTAMLCLFFWHLCYSFCDFFKKLYVCLAGGVDKGTHVDYACRTREHGPQEKINARLVEILERCEHGYQLAPCSWQQQLHDFREVSMQFHQV